MEAILAQSHKKQKLSGQQDFCRKNFPDKTRKSCKFSNSRQMRVKGVQDFALKHFIDYFNLIYAKLNTALFRLSGNFPDHPDTF